jgi:putative acyl-CoA dehydrogenase
VTKMAPAFIYETLECLGGNGYVEDFPIARLYREAPLNAIWEGSGNVMALGVLRALRKGDAGVIGALAGTCGAPGKSAADEIGKLAAGDDAETHARRIAEKLARLGALAALHEVNGDLAEAYAARGAHETWGASDLVAVEKLVLDRVVGL